MLIFNSIPTLRTGHPAILAPPDVRRVHLQRCSELLHLVADQRDLFAQGE